MGQSATWPTMILSNSSAAPTIRYPVVVIPPVVIWFPIGGTTRAW